MKVKKGILPMQSDLPHIEIYTDGGCDPNPGPGGWAVILVDLKTGKEKEISGSESQTTNNRMELTAAIEALRTLKNRCHIDFHTDSQYVKKGITEWIEGWIARNWQRKKSPIENVDLWQELHRLCQQHEITWHWVKGHAGHDYNERADRLASAAIPRAVQQIDPSAIQIYLRLSDEDVRRSSPRGWAACIVREGDEEVLSGGHRDISPNHFGLFAVLEVLRQLQDERPIQFFLTNKFVYDGIMGWVAGWRDGGWVKPEKFKAEWKTLDKFDRQRKITWVYMRDPKPDEYNRLEEITSQARAKASHLPMPPELKAEFDEDAGTLPML
jgi:ribonuclease HI